MSLKAHLNEMNYFFVLFFIIIFEMWSDIFV
jgi:hypothetical protein